MSIISNKSFAYDIEVNGFYYNVLSATTLEVTYGDKKYSGDVSIPATVTYNGKTFNVVSVGIEAFAKCEELLSISMGNNISSIGDRAFYGCSSLKSYSFKTSNIGSYAFAFCTSIQSAKLNMKFIPEGMFRGCSSLSSFSLTGCSSIGAYAFAGCTALNGDLSLSTSVGSGSFSGCTGITSVTFNAYESIYIGVDAFAHCTSIKSVKLVSKSKYGYIYDIGKGFGLCPNLKEINIDDYQFGELYDGGLYSKYINGYLISEHKECLQFLTPQNSDVFVVPSTVRTINSYAFSTAGTLRRIVLGSSKISLIKGAFLNCPDLKELYCYSKTPSNIEFSTPPEIIRGWFHEDLVNKLRVYVPLGCKSSYEKVWPWNEFILDEFDVTCFDPYVRSEEVDGIKYQITSDTEVEVVHKDDYSGDIVIPETVSIDNKEYKVTSIAKGAFWGCKTINSIKIASSVRTIGRDAFRKCESLKEIELPEDIIYLDTCVFSQCYSLKTIKLPTKLQGIELSAFVESGLNSIEIPSQVYRIGGFAFQNNKSLRTIVTSERIKEIYYYSFSYCDSLKTVVLGKNVSYIGCNAFEGCRQLSRIYSLNPIPPYLNQRFDNGAIEMSWIANSLRNTFNNIDTYNVTLYVPIGSTEAYQNNKDWGKFIHIIEFDPSTFDFKSLLENEIPTPFVGTWLGSYTIDGTNYNEQWIFNQDGTGSVTNWHDGEDDKSIISFTYTFTDYSISITIRHDEFSYGISQYPYSLSGDIFTLTKGNELIHYYKQSDETGIYSIASSDDIKVIHSIRGEKLQTSSKGINIIKMKDGTVKKVLVK